ncbi:MAG: SMP-30/gluconolactonase/LRE family protein [Mariniphaga sp.]
MSTPIQHVKIQIPFSQPGSVIKSQRAFLVLMVILQLFLGSSCKKDVVESISEGELQCVVSDLQFGEGPAFYNGSLYFSDIKANTIYRWNESSGKTIFRENSGGANGLYSSSEGNLVVCEGGNKRIVSIDPSQKVTLITDSFGGKPYNEPNDLWISPSGNIYFTDPVFTGTQTQDGLNVYCVLAATGSVKKVVNDLVKPNGIIGNSAGTLLYVADYGASKIYKYSISSDGSLGNKQLFASVQADGLTIDNDGNLYAASTEVLKFNTNGVLLKRFQVPGTITNLCYMKASTEKLFITTHTGLYIEKLGLTF